MKLKIHACQVDNDHDYTTTTNFLNECPPWLSSVLILAKQEIRKVERNLTSEVPRQRYPRWKPTCCSVLQDINPRSRAKPKIPLASMQVTGKPCPRPYTANTAGSLERLSMIVLPRFRIFRWDISLFLHLFVKLPIIIGSFSLFFIGDPLSKISICQSLNFQSTAAVTPLSMISYERMSLFILFSLVPLFLYTEYGIDSFQ